MTIARQHEQVKLQRREQQLEHDQHVAETRLTPSPRTAGRYTKPKDRHTASKYRWRAYIFQVVKNVPIDVSAHAQLM